jgi:hypothetical protein
VGVTLPPLLALARLVCAAGHRVRILASNATREVARRDGFDTFGYRSAPQPDTSVPFEARAADVFRTLADIEIARDVRDVLEERRPDPLVADCMLPAAQAVSTPAVSLVHFLSGPARSQMARTSEGWTTDLEQLSASRANLGLPLARDGVAAWEAVDPLLVVAPWGSTSRSPTAERRARRTARRSRVGSGLMSGQQTVPPSASAVADGGELLGQAAAESRHECEEA